MGLDKTASSAEAFEDTNVRRLRAICQMFGLSVVQCFAVSSEMQFLDTAVKIE